MLFRSPRWESVTYWALDLETGGLDPRADAILAVGMVPIRGGFIRLAEAYRTLVRPEPGRRVQPASIEAHQLVARDLDAAPPLAAVLPEVERRLREGILLVHHARLDVAFLQRAMRAAGGSWPSPTVVDTQRLLLRLARLEDPTTPQESLTLDLAGGRARHGLPAHQAHDALSDAIATAELFLALRLALRARTVRDLR